MSDGGGREPVSRKSLNQELRFLKLRGKGVDKVLGQLEATAKRLAKMGMTEQASVMRAAAMLDIHFSWDDFKKNKRSPRG